MCNDKINVSNALPVSPWCSRVSSLFLRVLQAHAPFFIFHVAISLVVLIFPLITYSFVMYEKFYPQVIAILLFDGFSFFRFSQKWPL